MMHRRLPVLPALAAALLLQGCSTVALDTGARDVKVLFAPPPATCSPVHEVVGSDGHWYNFLFLPHEAIGHGAFNAIRNDAARHGANRVYVVDRVDGQEAAMTFYGLAYHCPD